MRRFFVFTGASILLAISYGPASSQEFAKGMLIVKFRTEINVRNEKGIVITDIVEIDRLNQRYGVKQAEKMFGGYRRKADEIIVKSEIIKVPSLSNIYRLEFDENADIFSAVREYESNPLVIYAEPDYIAYACVTPNDPYFGEQWGLKKIQAEQAWDTTTGDSSVIIGFLDTGIDTAHPDLKNNLWINEAEYNGTPGVDDDGNGKIDDIQGWNFVNDNNNPSDGAGHGTHCAGTVAAVTDNNIGVAGVSWNSKLMAVRVLNNNGQGLYSHIAEGIIYAAQNGAKVINMSLGGYVYSSLWWDALVNAYATSVPVGAVGNDNTAQLFYPACFPMVLGVAATDSFDIKWDGSNYGEWIDLSAPGVGIYNTRLDDYARFTGTSCAAPFVSGVAALVASHKSEFSTGAIMSMIVNNAEPIDTLNPDYAGRLGSGRLNAYLALTGNPMPKLIVLGDTIKDPTGDGDGIPDADETVDLILILQNKGMDATGVSATLHTDDPDITISDPIADFGDILARDKSSNSADVFTFSLSATCPQHDALFELYLTANGGAYEDTVEFSIATSNERNVSGVINADTIWKRGTYIVDGNVLIDSGATLTIEPGTEIRLDSAKTIMIKGILNVIGTSTDSIIFTKNSPDTNKRWGNLWLKPASKGNFKYCRIEWAGNSSIYNEGDSLYVGYSTISNNSFPINSWSGGGGICNYGSATATITNNTISNNFVYPSLYGGSGIYGGGIYNGGGTGQITATITNNAISNNSVSGSSSTPHYAGGGICNSGLVTATITNNIISNNSAYPLYGGGGGICHNSGGATATITNNTISNNFASRSPEYGGSGGPCVGGIYVDGYYAYLPTISYNTIIDTSLAAIFINYNGSAIHNNNLLATHYAVYDSLNDLSADSNWWGTTNTAKIDSLIYDFNDNMNLGVVNYTPFLTSPSKEAPPYLDSLRVYPDPVGIETLYAYLTFSKPMDTTIAPEVLFAFDDTVFDTLNALQINGSWTDSMHWNGWYLIDEMVIDTVYRIKVSDARDDAFPFPIPQDTRHTFRVYTAGSASRELIAESGTDRITLHWHPSNISNLLGYNIYRDTTSGGPYELVNSKVITDTAYADTTMPRGRTCYYVYTILDNNFKESSYSSEASGYIGVEERPIPVVFALSGASPNPFVDHTRIKYAIPKKTWVSLKVYDITGRLVKSLVNKQEKPGYYAVKWDGKDDKSNKPASGIYFCRLETSEYKATKKIISLH